MDRMFIVSPTTRVWNHKPSNGPMSIASRRLSRSGSSVSKSMLVSPMITPGALVDDGLCGVENAQHAI